ncbi:MAG TPA: short-chain dehydrogenase [Lentisphaeria bacterium]|nr:MAG: short-chain dehydrogenase [Lentisphaerae bacterium GWF2_50_93]HCE44906.1 short-chain dehydrogenase [Lentisphaeria bacterium]
MSSNTKKLTGKVAVVTGASKGIGASIARHLAAEGASVVVNYASSREGADRVVAEITGKGGRAVAVQGDVAQKSDVERLFAETKKTFGALDILVNNAGIYVGVPVGQITEEHFRRHFNLNVLGVILATQEALKYFGPEGGSIVNISSVVSTLSPAGMGVYNATKSAVDGLTRTFAKELGPRKIRVNSVSPGPVETEGTRAAGVIEQFQAYAALTPLGRIGQPDDIASAVVFFASADSVWITGESLCVCGGFHG